MKKLEESERQKLVDFTRNSSDNYTKSAFDFAYSSLFFEQGRPAIDFQYVGRMKNSSGTSGRDIGDFFRGFGFELGSSFYEESIKDASRLHRYEENRFAAFYAGENGYIKTERTYNRKKINDWMYFDVTVDQKFCEETDFINKFVDRFCILEKEPNEEQPGKGSVHTLVSIQGGYDLTEFENISLRYQPDNYPKDINEGFRILVDNFSLPNPDGRLTLLTGNPGTGKTYFIRGLVDAVPNGKFIVIDAETMASVARPDMIGLFKSVSSSNHPTILIVEDADSVIIKRMSDNINYISHLLNLTDGLLGQGLNIHIVASTNQSHLEVDPALRRPGRMHQILHFGMLSTEDARRIYKREVGKDPEDLIFKPIGVVPARNFGFSVPKTKENQGVEFSIAEVYSHIRKNLSVVENEDISEQRNLSFMMFK